MPRTFTKLQQIHSELAEKISAGVWKCGERLPTTTELAKTYECSIGIVSKAIAMLVHEGVVEQRSRLGTRVIASPVDSLSSAVSLDAFAFIFPSTQHEGIWRTVRGFEAAASAHSRKTVMITTGTDFHKEAESILRLAEFDVKGAAIYSNAEKSEDRLAIARSLLHSKFPVVLSCMGASGLEFPSIFYDDFHAGYTMTKYLLGKGLRRIGFLSVSRTAMALRGHRWAFEEAGLTPDPRLVEMESSMHANFEDPLAEPTLLAEKYLRSRAGALEGVVCGFDFFAHGLIRAAGNLGIRIPEDLKVVGIDDFAIASEIPLTTYHVPYERIGQRSFEVLNDLIRGQAPEVLEEHLRGEIVIRDSA